MAIIHLIYGCGLIPKWYQFLVGEETVLDIKDFLSLLSPQEYMQCLQMWFMFIFLKFQVLYFGDSIKSDLYPSAVFGNWHVVTLLEEMESEGMEVTCENEPEVFHCFLFNLDMASFPQITSFVRAMGVHLVLEACIAYKELQLRSPLHTSHIQQSTCSVIPHNS